MLIQLLTFFSLISFQPAQNPSEIPVYDFAAFKPYLEKNNDTTYVINFWATWCGPCVKELPYFDRLGEEFKDKKLKVILVSLDFAEKLETSVKPFLLKKGVKSEVMILDDQDANSWIPKVDSLWSGAIPATLIYKGSKREFYGRDFTFEELKEKVEPFLN